MSKPQTVQSGKVAIIAYTLRDDSGKVLDRADDDDALAYLHGNHNIIPGLERELEGRPVGDEFSCVIEAKDAYGERHEGGQHKLGRDQFPADAPLREGMQFFAEAEDGRPFPFWISVVGDDEVTIDMNHPLAGERLKYKVRVVGVREPTADELAHGHAHGADGQAGHDHGHDHEHGPDCDHDH